MGDPGHLGADSRRALCVDDAAAQRQEASAHVPVLYQAVLDGLNVRPGGRYIDATVGGGGHASGILAASSPDGSLLGLDRDPAALDVARARLLPYAARVSLERTSFARIAEVVRTHKFAPVDGILFDLGLSSLQLADSARGFAFSVDGPLDMRFNPTAGGPTAATLVNELSRDELVKVLYRFGEEAQARRIAEAIVAARPLQTTQELASVIEGAVRRRRRVHPATRTFQALRIAVNDELTELEFALPQTLDVLAPGGRLAVISFHSLEDRIVKRFIRQESRDCICPPEVPACMCDHRAALQPVTRKPIRPAPGEVAGNPRARSGRLRVAERLE